jgi:chemotaxis protein MotA
MNLPIGWIVAIGSGLIGFFMLGQPISRLWVPEEVIIVFGAAAGALIAANRFRNLKNIASAIKRAFKRPSTGRQENLQLLCLMFDLLQKTKRDGPMSIEKDVESPDSSSLFLKYPEVLKNDRLVEFITDYFRMMMDGSVTLVQLEAIMRQEIDVLHEEASDPARSVFVLADSLPAFGIVAAIVGVIKALSSVGVASPAAVAEALSAALIGTLLGVFLSYAFAQPVGRTLEQVADGDTRPFEAVKEILIANYSNFSPMIAVEYGRKVLFSDQRPSMIELEAGIRGSVATK